MPHNARDSEDNIIQIVAENGSICGGIPTINNSVFIVHRKNKNYFIDRVDKEFFLGHLIYKKISKGKNKAVNSIIVKNVRQIRQGLIKHYNSERDDNKKEIPVSNSKTKLI